MGILHRYIKWILCAVMLLAIGIGFFNMGGIETIRSATSRESTVTAISKGWSYRVNGSDEVFKTELPSILPLEEDAREIVLTNTLPNGIKAGDAVRIQTLSGWFDIYIDRRLRVEYGNHEITDSYWYENASALLFIKLTEEDSGKEIAIHTGSIDAHHLAIQREPFIGYHRDFLMGDMIESYYINILIIVLVVASFLLLCVWLFFFIKKQRFSQIPPAVAFLLMMVLYYNVCNLFMMEFLSYARDYFSLNDFVYYVMNIFLPVAGYMIILPHLKKEGSRLFRYFVALHIVVALIAFVLQIVSVENYEPVEKLAAVMTAIGYIWIVVIFKKHPVSWAEKLFIYPVCFCVFACVLDYCKYMMNLDWLPDAVANYLQVESPFMIFLPFTMVIYMFMILIGIVNVILKKQTELAIEAKSAELRATLAEKEFIMTMDSMNQIRKIRHDIEHHFFVIDTYLEENDIVAAKAYIESASAMVPKQSLSGKNLITGSFTEQYRSLCEQNGIKFTDSVLFDEEMISNKTALGIILGNGLKNAFESALTAQDEQRFIRISGKQVHDNITIVIENGFNHEIKPDYKSTKEKGRGRGISNIRDAAMRCGGYLECRHTDNVFILEAVLVM